MEALLSLFLGIFAYQHGPAEQKVIRLLMLKLVHPSIGDKNLLLQLTG